MAMIQCYECTKEVSDLAAACPNCGAPSRAGGTAPVGRKAAGRIPRPRDESHDHRMSQLMERAEETPFVFGFSLGECAILVVILVIPFWLFGPVVGILAAIALLVAAALRNVSRQKRAR